MSRIRVASWLAIGLSFSLVSASFADVELKPEEKDHILALVKQLGDDEFDIREQATTELVELGAKVRPILEKSRRSGDREVRYRVVRILALIEQYDFERRLTAFANGKGKASDYSLPGWKSYAQFFGDSAESRTLFVKIQQHESELMGAIDGGPAVASEALGIRVQELQALARTNSPINEGSFAAVLFAARSDKVQVSPQTASLIYSLCHHRSAQTAFSRGANRKAMRQLLGQWIAKGEDWAAYQGMTLAMRFGLKAGLEPATRSLSNAATQTHIQQYALLTIAKLGDRSHLPLLESMLDRKDQCSARRVRTNNMLVEYKTELRDIALACILRVLDKNERAFGFKNADRNEQYVYNTTSLGFSSNEERERVFAKWAELKKELDKKASEEQAGDEKEGAEKKAGEQQSSDDSP